MGVLLRVPTMNCPGVMRGTSGSGSHLAVLCRGQARALTQLRADSVVERPAVLEKQIPMTSFPEQASRDLKAELTAQLGQTRWDIAPDEFDDIAYSCIRDHLLDGQKLGTLHGMLADASTPSAVHLTGLPTEDDLPATLGKPPIAKDSQIAEALLMGFSRIWGRATGFPSTGPPGICRDLIAVESTAFSSSSELVMHRDFGIAEERQVPNIRIIYCLRPDKKREVETLVADNRDLIAALDSKDLQLLRTVPVTISGPGLGVPKLIIQGSDELPIVSLFDMAVFGDKATISAEDSQAVDAYYRAADVAMEVAAKGVRLQEGEMLIINNNRATHARTRSPHEPDGYGRWMKVTFVKAGAGPGSARYLDV